MRLIYFDEVKYQKGSQPYYFLAGLIVSADDVWYLENELSIISEECFGTSILTRQTEFHASDIFHRKANFKSWKDPKKRAELLTRLAKVLDSRPNIGKAFVCIKPEQMLVDTSFDDKAFMFFTEKIESHLQSIRSPGLLIGDRENKKVSEQFAEDLSSYRRNGTLYQLGTELLHLIDTVHFTDSHHSRMLQLADLYVWLLQLQFNSDEDDKNHLRRLVLDFVSKETQIFKPTKYKIWPNQQW